MRITGRPVMITGAASGIGRALARRLSALGSPVAIADVDEAGLRETAAALPGPVLTRVLDVRDAADQLRFADEVRAWLPAPLAAVFNNAGVAVTSSVLDAVPEDDDWLYDINFKGVVNGTRAFLPILVDQGRNARIRKDPEGLGRTKAELAAQFEAATMTSPEKAAAIIHRGVERGKARILVGPDAHLFDALARIAPTHYYPVLARLMRLAPASKREVKA